MVHVVAGQAEGLEVRQAMGSLSLGMMHAEMVRATTVGTDEAITDRRSEHPFVDVDGRLAMSSCLTYAKSIGVQTLCWLSFPTGVVFVGRVLRQVGMGKTIPSLLEVPRPLEFYGAWEPLIRFEGVFPFTDRGDPPGPVMDNPGLGSDEPLFPAALVLAKKPMVVAMPGIPADLFQVTMETRVLVILTPASHDGIERCQTRILIHPGPVSGSEFFDPSLDALFPRRGGSKMSDPSSFGLTTLNVKTQEREAVVDVGDHGLRRRQLQVEFMGEKVSNLLLGRLHTGHGVIADDDEVG